MLERADSGCPARGILHVIHGHGGGTEHHARALIAATRTCYRHHLAIAVGDAWQVEEHLADGAIRRHEIRRGSAEPWPDFFGGIRATFAIDLVHLHNISGCRDGIVAALAAQDVPYGYTVHDLSFACPTILFLGADGNYCHEETDAAVCQCVPQGAAPVLPRRHRGLESSTSRAARACSVPDRAVALGRGGASTLLPRPRG